MYLFLQRGKLFFTIAANFLPMSAEDLKECIEELSEHEVKRAEIIKNLSEIARNLDIGEINELPVLYRIELKKALKEVGESELASSIES